MTKRVVDFESELLPIIDHSGIAYPTLWQICYGLAVLSYKHECDMECDARFLDNDISLIFGENNIIRVATKFNSSSSVGEIATRTLNAIWVYALRHERLKLKTKLAKLEAENLSLKRASEAQLKAGSVISIHPDALIHYTGIESLAEIFNNNWVVNSVTQMEDGTCNLDLVVGDNIIRDILIHRNQLNVIV